MQDTLSVANLCVVLWSAYSLAWVGKTFSQGYALLLFSYKVHA